MIFRQRGHSSAPVVSVGLEIIGVFLYYRAVHFFFLNTDSTDLFADHLCIISPICGKKPWLSNVISIQIP